MTHSVNERLLVLNAGSSSLKFAIYERVPELPLLLIGSVSRLGSQEPRLKIWVQRGEELERRLQRGPMEPRNAVEEVFNELRQCGMLNAVSAVGHRIVHGGVAFTHPTLLDPKTLTELRGLVPLAPLHQPYNLDIVEAAATLLPDAQQVGCFDTSFHSQRPAIDRLYGLPRELSDEGIISYGFHGLSYAHIAEALTTEYGEGAGGLAIVAHLGSGASLCAMSAGRSVSTTMGFSALEGLVMSSRCGSIDPGIIFHLIGHYGMSLQTVTDLLYNRSGLLGVSGGLSGDMQTLLESNSVQAAEAIDLFVYKITRAIGSLAAVLGGLDTLVFTAGIGENEPVIRRRIGDAARWLGVKIDDEHNQNNFRRINTADSKVDVLVIPTNEERSVAGGVLECVGAA